MTANDRSRGADALAAHDAFEETAEGFSLSTTTVETRVNAETRPDGVAYAVEIRAPTIDSATVDEVGQTVSTDWFETYRRRVQDAPSASRHNVELDETQVFEEGPDVVVRYRYTWGEPPTGVDIAKTLIEYVEGTYVQGIIPGYEYTDPVSRLLSQASQGGEGGTPL